MYQKATIHFLGVDKPIYVEENNIQDLFEHLERFVKVTSRDTKHEISSIEFDLHVSSIQSIRDISEIMNEFSQNKFLLDVLSIPRLLSE